MSVQGDAASENQGRAPRGGDAESRRTNYYVSKCIQGLGYKWVISHEVGEDRARPACLGSD